MNKGHLQLVVVVLGVLAIWGVALPMLSKSKTVRQRERWLQQYEINPAAMFYTELPVLDKVLSQSELRAD